MGTQRVQGRPDEPSAISLAALSQCLAMPEPVSNIAPSPNISVNVIGVDHLRDQPGRSERWFAKLCYEQQPLERASHLCAMVVLSAQMESDQGGSLLASTEQNSNLGNTD